MARIEFETGQTKKEGKNMNWYLHCWKKCLTFSGRARRKEYCVFFLLTWTFVVGFFVVSIIAGLPEWFAGEVMCGTGTEDELIEYLPFIFFVPSLLPYWAVSVRRLHDLNLGGGWLFVNCVPIIGPLIGPLFCLALMVLRGSRGANRYGEDPREERPRGGERGRGAVAEGSAKGGV